MENKCPNCSEKLSCIIEPGSITWKCNKCGWSVSGQNTEPIYSDVTDYSLKIEKSDLSKDNLKCLSSLTGFNYIKCRNILITGEQTFNGRAFEIIKIKKILDDSKINYSIFPDFKY